MEKSKSILLITTWLITIAMFITFILGKVSFPSVLVLFIISLVLTGAFRNS